MVKLELQKASVLDYDTSALNMAKAVASEIESWKKKPDEATPALRRIERILDVPQYRREQFREGLAAAFELKGQRGRPLYTRHPPLEEGINRALLPAWKDVVRGFDDHSESLVAYAKSELTSASRKGTASGWE